MEAQHKLKIDRLIGGPLSFLLNLVARGLGYLMRRDHIFPENPRMICVAKFSGLGSIVAAIPMVQELKRRYSKSTLVFVSSQNNADLLDGISFIDKRLYVSEKSFTAILGSTIRVLWGLWRLRPVLYFDLEIYSYYSSMVATLSCARNRLGFYRKSAWVKKGLFTHLVFFNTTMPIQQLYLQLARTAGCSTPTHLPRETFLSVQPEDYAEAAQVLGNWLDTSQKLLLVNANASDLCLERRWPQENFVRAIGELLEMVPSLQVALVGSREERAYVFGLHANLAHHRLRVRNLAGEISLGGLLALLERADCFLTNDSGPMHIAAALGRPMVALFGPVHPTHYAAQYITPRTIVLYEPVFCSPCVHHADFPPCSGDNQCMKLIEPASVVRACLPLLLSSEAPPAGSLPQSWTLSQSCPRVNGPDGLPLGMVVLRHPVAWNREEKG